MKKILRFLFPSPKETLALSLCACLILAGAAFSAFSPRTEASSSQSLTGYAWGASYLSGSSGPVGGIGWISFNCSNDSSCAASPYSVTIDSSGYLQGYAWSAAYGWIRFGGLSGFPSGSGTTADNARLSGNSLSGWARICSATSNGDCTGTTRSDSDGWISLAGTFPGLGGGGLYGIVVSGTSLSGQAWAGPDVGWIDFSAVGGLSGSGVRVGSVAAVDLKVSTGSSGDNPDGPVTVSSGKSLALSWTSQGIPSGASCTTSGDAKWASTSRPSSSGSSPVSYAANAPVVLSISCPDGRGGIVADSVTIRISSAAPSAPIADIQAYDPSVSGYVDGPLTLNSGDSLQLRWNPSGAGDTVECIGRGYGFSTSGNPSGAVNIAASSTQVYSIRCDTDHGASGSYAVDGVSVIVANPSGACADPAGISDVASGASRRYFNAPQAGKCLWEVRTCTASTTSPGVMYLSNDPSYNSASCSMDPTIIEQ